MQDPYLICCVLIHINLKMNCARSFYFDWICLCFSQVNKTWHPIHVYSVSQWAIYTYNQIKHLSLELGYSFLWQHMMWSIALARHPLLHEPKQKQFAFRHFSQACWIDNIAIKVNIQSILLQHFSESPNNSIIWKHKHIPPHDTE